jgi:hypothetical protein
MLRNNTALQLVSLDSIAPGLLSEEEEDKILHIALSLQIANKK